MILRMGRTTEPAEQGELDRRGTPSGGSWLSAAIVLSWVGAAVVGAIRVVGTSPAEGWASGVVSSATLAVVLATPGAVASIGRRASTPSLVIAAGVALVPLGLISIATLPLLVVAATFVVAGIRMPAGSGWPAVLLSILTVATTIAALAVMFVHQDPRSIETPPTASGVSDVVTPLESLAALTLVGITIGLAGLAALSRRGRSGAAPRS